MAGRQEASPVNGLLILDKPAGMTSHDALAQVRMIFHERSVGHVGTLDPMATGVLPLLLGRYTRLAQFFSGAEKEYTGTIRFGFATDTYDAEGSPATDLKRLAMPLEEIRGLASTLLGPIQQMPPAYSAKKLNGVPAHKLARAGLEVPVKPVPVTVREFALISLDGDRAAFTANVSAGTYIRTLAHDLGALVGCGAHLASLRRTRVGRYGLTEAVSLDALRAAGDPTALLAHPREILVDLPAVTVPESIAGRIRNGMQVNLPVYGAASHVRAYLDQTDLFAILRPVAGTLMQPVVVLG